MAWWAIHDKCLQENKSKKQTELIDNVIDKFGIKK